MAQDTRKNYTAIETKIGEYAAAQPCSGVKEVFSHVQSIGMACALPGAEPLTKKPA
jgi:hypothetical protein